MKFTTLTGKKKPADITKYLVDWDGGCRGKSIWGKFQYDVKQFLRTYWENHVVCEELPCFGTASEGRRNLRLDLVNLTRGTAIEVNGKQHGEYVEFFHGDRSGYLDQIERDGRKSEWCEMNELELVYIMPNDKLSVSFFKEQGIIL
jgi:hypothetical protein